MIGMLFHGPERAESPYVTEIHRRLCDRFRKTNPVTLLQWLSQMSQSDPNHCNTARLNTCATTQVDQSSRNKKTTNHPVPITTVT